jgi:iron(III) transport system permease protein
VWGHIGGWGTLLNTLQLVVWTPLFAVALSFVIAMVTVRSTLPGRRALDTIAMLPHVVPGIAFAFAMILFGILLNRWLGIPLYGTLAVIVVAVVVERIPYCTRITNAALLQLHREIEEAASVCGAGRFQTAGRIVLPLVRPSLAYAALWVALLSLREVTIPLLLASPNNTVLSVRIWTLWETGNYGPASAIGVSLFVCTAAVLLAGQRWLRATGVFDR